MIAHFSEVFAPRPALYAIGLTLDPASVADRRYGPYRKLLIHMWGRFMTNVKRACNRVAVERAYVGVVERNDGGSPHIHALVSCPHPEAEKLLPRLWFQQGGGAVIDVQPLTGGEREVAMYVGYMCKYQFGPTGLRGRFLTSHGTGYYAPEFKARRRQYVRGDGGEGVILDPLFEPGWRSAATASAPMSGFALERRRNTYVRRREASPYGVRVTVSEEGSWRYDAVRVEWDAERGQHVHVTLLDDVGSMSAAETAVDGFVSGSVENEP